MPFLCQFLRVENAEVGGQFGQPTGCSMLQPSEKYESNGAVSQPPNQLPRLLMLSSLTRILYFSA